MEGFVIDPALSDGLRLTRRDISITLDAMRADILRVRIDRPGIERHASFALTEAARTARAPSQIDRADNVVRLSTSDWTAAIDRVTGAIDIAGADGHPILSDADAAAHHDRRGGFSITKRLGAGLSFYGLGDKPCAMNRRGRHFANWNTDSYAFQEGQDPLYKDIPFFIGYDRGRAFGVFLDNTYRTHFDFGSTDDDILSFGATGGAIDYYVLTGPAPADVVRAYAFLTGAPPMPPKWALGYQQSRYSYRTATEALAVAERLRAEHIPADVIWFDLHVLDRNRSFTIDARAFPDFPGLVARLHDLDFRVVIITDFQIAQVADEDYAPYAHGSALDAFVRRGDGTTYAEKSWGGPSVFPDFSHAPARRFWGDLYADLLAAGVDGFWNDMNEPALFSDIGTFAPDIVHRVDDGDDIRHASHAEMHNVYGSLNGQATREGLARLRPSLRPFVMMRAAYAGGQRQAVTWTGDNLSSWGHLRLSTPMLLSLGLGGFAFSGVNLGGFVGAPSPELLTRWLQIGMFNPIANNHSDLATPMQEPWVHGPEHLAYRRSAIEGRYRLLPYLYTLAEEAGRTGLPLMRPMFLEWPDAARGHALDLTAPSQFMLGSALLVAPEPYGEMPGAYEVVLPPGDWFDTATGLRVADLGPAKLTGNSGTSTELDADDPRAPHMIMVQPRPEAIAVFARAGSIVPSHAPIPHTRARIPGPLILDVYAAASCQGALYDDDGITAGAAPFLRMALAASFDQGRFRIEIAHEDGGFPRWWSEIELRVHGISSFGGEAEGREAEFDPQRALLTLRLPAASGCMVIEGDAMM